MDNRGYELIIEELLKLLDSGVYIVDADGRGLFYNEAMAAMEEINVEDVVGKEYHRAFPGVPLNESTLYKALNKRLATRNKEQTYKNLYGKEITTINSTVPVIDGGQVVAAVEVAKDITNIRSMSDRILTLQETKIERSKPVKPTIKKYTFDDITGESEAFEAVIDRAKKAAKSDVSVFIYGETGTGKELFSQSIHYASSRKNKPFLAQNCAALPESLLEGILFGTAKGGFTGAVDRAGLFEQASGGTLLLDEISAMPYDLQSKLLRVLQEKKITRLGGTSEIPINARIVAATNRNLEDMVREGTFREDLFYRLNVVRIHIPPLRERPVDIPVLAAYIITKYSKEMGLKITGFTPEALDALRHHSFYGNVRELENIIERAMIFADSETIGINDLDLRSGLQKNDVPKAIPASDVLTLRDAERNAIIRALQRWEGNRTRAAEELGISRRTLISKIQEYGIGKESL